MYEPQTYSSSLFQSFKAIDVDSYRSILRFVEDHSTDISLLPVREYFSLQYAYVAALYETGGYVRVVALTKELLELSIIHGISEVESEDVYRALLFRRASAQFHLMRYEDCTHTCDQLLRLYPDLAAASLLYEKALYQRRNQWIARARAISVALFLAAAGLIAAEVLVIHHLFEGYEEAFAYGRNACFLIGWTLLLGGDVSHRAWAWWYVRSRRTQYAEVRSQRSSN